MDRLAGRAWLLSLVAWFVVACEERRTPIPRPGQLDAPIEASQGFDGGVIIDGLVLEDQAPAPDFPETPIDDPDAGDVPGAETGPACGNGRIETGEVCDDGNTRPADGCSGVCLVEPNFMCPAPGQPCVSTIVCGDGKITGNEACDDSNAASADGCSSSCQVEPGFACKVAGQACEMVPQNTARCGDGQVNAGEGCDDGNTTGADGCSASCSLEGGFVCPTPGMACMRDAFCGDGRLDAGEMCDDGNVVPGQVFPMLLL